MAFFLEEEKKLSFIIILASTSDDPESSRENKTVDADTNCQPLRRRLGEEA